jgi:hypothetical protein
MGVFSKFNHFFNSNFHILGPLWPISLLVAKVRYHKLLGDTIQDAMPSRDRGLSDDQAGKRKDP